MRGDCLKMKILQLNKNYGRRTRKRPRNPALAIAMAVVTHLNKNPNIKTPMKKIYSIILLSLLIISCSDNNNNNILDIENPTINEVSTNTASSGDIIIIYGENFNPDENYIIKFNDIKGEIIEITTNSIKVQVPENATSGNITIIINLQIILVGDITIENTILFQKKHSRIRGVEHIIQTKDNNYVSIGGVNNSNIKLMTLTKYDEYGEIIWENIDLIEKVINKALELIK